MRTNAALAKQVSLVLARNQRSLGDVPCFVVDDDAAITSDATSAGSRGRVREEIRHDNSTVRILRAAKDDDPLCFLPILNPKLAFWQREAMQRRCARGTTCRVCRP